MAVTEYNYYDNARFGPKNLQKYEYTDNYVHLNFNFFTKIFDNHY